jgi:hypothetical protein
VVSFFDRDLLCEGHELTTKTGVLDFFFRFKVQGSRFPLPPSRDIKIRDSLLLKVFNTFNLKLGTLNFGERSELPIHMQLTDHCSPLS